MFARIGQPTITGMNKSIEGYVSMLKYPNIERKISIISQYSCNYKVIGSIFTLILLMFCCIDICTSCTFILVSFRELTVAFRSLIWLPNVATLLESAGTLANSGAAWKHCCTLCKPCWICVNCKNNTDTINNEIFISDNKIDIMDVIRDALPVL